MRRESRSPPIIFAMLLLVAGASPSFGQYWSGYIAAHDGVQLATDVYLPLGEAPWPVVLVRTPYDKRDPGHYADWCRTLNQHGYACVAQDCRGRFASGGTDTLFRDASRDGLATLEWIALRPWCNGAIASAGGSAMGITGYAMAAQAPPELKCLMVSFASPDLYHQIIFHGGSLREELVVNWLERQGSSDLLAELRDHRVGASWWDDYDYLSQASTVNLKALHFGAWWDLYIQGPIDGFRHYQHRGGPGAVGNQHLIMGPWTHHSLATPWMAMVDEIERTTGEFTYPDNAFPGAWPFGEDEWQLLLDWLGYCLADQPTAAAGWPAARVYLMGAVAEQGAPGNRWVDLEDWPPQSATVPFYLTALNELERKPPADGQLILEIDPGDPVPTLGGPNNFRNLEVDGRLMGAGPYDQRQVEARDDVLVFTSDLLEQPLTVMGRVRCRLWVRPDTPDFDLSVRLTDVYPDGRSMLMLDGIQRARMRCGDDQECFTQPGVPVAIEVDLWSTAMVFNAGHRLRVAVAGSNWPRFEVNPSDGGDIDNGTPIVARPELLFGADYPSAILLPLVDSGRLPSGRRSPTPAAPEPKTAHVAWVGR